MPDRVAGSVWLPAPTPPTARVRSGRFVAVKLLADYAPAAGLCRALYAAPTYLAQAGTPAHPNELRRHQLITNSAATQLNHWPFVIDGVALKLTAEGYWRTNDTGIAASMVLQGLGIGRLATLVAEPMVTQGLLAPVLPQFVAPQPVPIYAVFAGGRQRLPKIKACVDYWAEWFGRKHRPGA